MSFFLIIFIFFLCILVEPKTLYKIPTVEDFFHNVSKSTDPIYANIEDYPYMAKLYINFADVQFQCGGTLITPVWILTAAHCVAPEKSSSTPKLILVCMGSSFLPSHTACENSRTVRLVSRPASTVDLAMLRLTKPFDHSKTIQPLNLKKYDLDKLEKTCKVMGWGWMQTGFTSPNLLQTDVKRMDNCFKQLICVMATDHAPCRGDSGGPLICNGVLVGVASVGENANCEGPSGVTIYIPVWENIKFIRQSIADSGSRKSLHIAMLGVCLLYAESVFPLVEWLLSRLWALFKLMY